MPKKTFKSGANLDTRSEEEKKKDYTFKEIVASANPVNWTEKPSDKWRSFPIFQQDGSGSCVAQTLAKQLGVLYYIKNGTYVHFSATDIYQRRSNKPASGMQGTNAFDIATEGVTLEALVPSQDMTDEQMDSVLIEKYKRDVGAIFKIPNYVQPPLRDIETIASIIQTTGKAVMVWFYFKIDEWTKEPTIKYPDLLNDSTALRHSVAAVDFTLYKGKKCLIIEDSWGTSHGIAGRRIISEDFFSKRNFFAAYPVSFVFDAVAPVKPIYKFTLPFEFGSTSNDVKALQNILKYEGFFPTNTESTGYYGAITAKGILAWQLKHQVASVEELQSLQGRKVGAKTIAKLNSLYGQ